CRDSPVPRVSSRCREAASTQGRWRLRRGREERTVIVDSWMTLVSGPGPRIYSCTGYRFLVRGVPFWGRSIGQILMVRWLSEADSFRKMADLPGRIPGRVDCAAGLRVEPSGHSTHRRSAH